ncbi:hypothetical protein [Paraherbaspirillum soli]|uniref:DUF4148 domain-containing protein n=1 Tax=Paraherbaspirillum soli TaxID=631222 RepID=A0ABW0M7R3_9BURK
MIMMFRKISVCLLLLATMMSVYARSDRVREERPEREAPPPSQYDARRGGGAPNQDWQNNRGRNVEQSEGNGRGKMSPDERRALRQQINEAGRDIYPPRR